MKTLQNLFPLAPVRCSVLLRHASIELAWNTAISLQKVLLKQESIQLWWSIDSKEKKSPPGRWLNVLSPHGWKHSMHISHMWNIIYLQVVTLINWVLTDCHVFFFLCTCDRTSLSKTNDDTGGLLKKCLTERRWRGACQSGCYHACLCVACIRMHA